MTKTKNSDDEIEAMVYDENFILTSIKDLLDRSDMSEDDKKYVTVSLWTQEQIPQIESDKQYEEYLQRKEQLEQSLPPRSDPSWDQAYAEFCRTPNGILAISYGARMIEWERSASGDGGEAMTDHEKMLTRRAHAVVRVGEGPRERV